MPMFASSGKRESNRAAWLVFAALVLLHLVLHEHLSLFGAAPNFLFALVACAASLLGPAAGCLAGFLCGLLHDLTGTGPVGLSALLMSVVGYALARVRLESARGAWRDALPGVALASLAYRVAYLAGLFVLGASGDASWVVPVRVALSCVLDVAVAALALAILGRLSTGGPASGGLHLS